MGAPGGGGDAGRTLGGATGRAGGREEEEVVVEEEEEGRRGPGPVAPPAAPPSGPAGAGRPVGAASASPGGGAGGLGRARLRGRDRGRRVSSAQSRRRPQPAPEKGQPGGRLGACEARHGGEADEPRGPRRTAKGAGLERPWQPLDGLGLGGLQTTFPRGPRVPRDGRGSASGAVRRRESFLWLYKSGLDSFSVFSVLGAFLLVFSGLLLRSMLCGHRSPGLLLCAVCAITGYGMDLGGGRRCWAFKRARGTSLEPSVS
ncbi:uncharacterized protein [Vulpes vulpes]|uniref:Uncharacterized protein n=1 Tax=Vulpes vulpes TaxID=9627 RepID=A0ABM4YLT2_VULVU